MIQCRIKPPGLAWVDETAAKLGVSRSELLRLTLSFACSAQTGFMKHARAQQAIKDTHHKD